MQDKSTFMKFMQPYIDQDLIDEVVDCLKSGWLATGPRVQKLTEMLKEYLNAPYIKPLTSATGGLHLALLALELQAGDEVITTPTSFAASSNMIVQAGGKPVFVETDLDTFNIDVNQIEKAITKKTKAILPVHFTGLPVDLDSIYEIAKKYNLRVIEDAAHAIGAKYKDKLIGSFGDIQVFSFHPNKNMTTGEGGCVATRDEKIARSIQIMGFHGIDREAWNRFSKEGSQHYDIIAPGFKYNMMDLQAAIGLHQLPHLEHFIERRQYFANRYLKLLADFPEWTLPKAPSYSHRHAWHLFTPLLNLDKVKMTRDEFINQMKAHNIGIGFHYDAIHLFSYYQKNYGYKQGDFPNAESIAERIVSLPLWPLMTEADQDRVLEAMKKVLRK